MIAVDTSALMAVVLDEPSATGVLEALERETEVLISAGTLAEALVVAARRNVSEPVITLVEELGFTVMPVTAAGARRVADAFARWGKGAHAAGLNFGDCFAYAVAQEHGCPLLFVGEDFARTDVVAA